MSPEHGIRPSLAALARACGVSAMTVSRALRNHPRVAASTREKVLAAAEAVGYRSDPKIGQLMQHLRSVRAHPSGEPLAMVWPDVTRREREDSPFLSAIGKGAKDRAETLGFSFNEYYLREPGMNAALVDRILYESGVTCVIMGQVVHRSHAHLRMTWDRYTVVTIGLGLWKPEFHRVQFHHYDGILQAMRWLKHHGRKRIACIIGTTTTERMFRVYQAAFLAFHPLGAVRAAALLLVTGDYTPRRLTAWLAKVKPDAVMGEHHSAQSFGIEFPPGVSYFPLNRIPGASGPPGLDQNNALVGAGAVDLLSAHFHRNERGIPDAPKILMIRGRVVGAD